MKQTKKAVKKAAPKKSAIVSPPAKLGGKKYFIFGLTFLDGEDKLPRAVMHETRYSLALSKLGKMHGENLVNIELIKTFSTFDEIVNKIV